MRDSSLYFYFICAIIIGSRRRYREGSAIVITWRHEKPIGDVSLHIWIPPKVARAHLIITARGIYNCWYRWQISTIFLTRATQLIILHNVETREADRWCVSSYMDSTEGRARPFNYYSARYLQLLVQVTNKYHFLTRATQLIILTSEPYINRQN